MADRIMQRIQTKAERRGMYVSAKSPVILMLCEAIGEEMAEQLDKLEETLAPRKPNTLIEPSTPPPDPPPDPPAPGDRCVHGDLACAHCGF